MVKKTSGHENLQGRLKRKPAGNSTTTYPNVDPSHSPNIDHLSFHSGTFKEHLKTGGGDNGGLDVTNDPMV